MKLKEINPGMVIHCKTKEEMECLLEHLHADVTADDIWRKSDSFGRTDCIRVGSDGLLCRISSIGDYQGFGSEITEFSDLVLPQLSAEEVLDIIGDICSRYINGECQYNGEPCPLSGNSECMLNSLHNAGMSREVVTICEEWKAEKEKKEAKMEFEWVKVCKIFWIRDNNMQCVHMEDIIPPAEMPRINGQPLIFSDEIECQNILKKYIKAQNDGQRYIAVKERICRVKG